MLENIGDYHLIFRKLITNGLTIRNTEFSIPVEGCIKFDDNSPIKFIVIHANQITVCRSCGEPEIQISRDKIDEELLNAFATVINKATVKDSKILAKNVNYQ